MTPRKPKSSWTRLNRRRVAELEAASRSVVSAAKPETPPARIAKIVAEAEHGRRAAG